MGAVRDVLGASPRLRRRLAVRPRTAARSASAPRWCAGWRRRPAVLEHPDVAEVRQELKRLLADIAHHVQRLHDLAYDEVELEIGGSE